MHRSIEREDSLMRLETTRKSDLAVRALIVLQQHPTGCKGGELADELCAGRSFMAQVMNALVKQGWVQSDPGPTGGYRLLVELGDLSVLDVVEAIEGPTDTGLCVVADRPCAEAGLCALHQAWSTARATLSAELSATSIATVALLGAYPT